MLDELVVSSKDGFSLSFNRYNFPRPSSVLIRPNTISGYPQLLIGI